MSVISSQRSLLFRVLTWLLAVGVGQALWLRPASRPSSLVAHAVKGRGQGEQPATAKPSNSTQKAVPSLFDSLGKSLSDFSTGLGAKFEVDLRSTSVSASAAQKKASMGLGDLASALDETVVKSIKDAPSALKTLSNPDSWSLLQSGVNPLEKPKLIGTFELTSTKQRAKLKRKAPEFEKKPNIAAPEVLLRTIRTLPSQLKYDYDLRVKAREKEEATALNRQLSDGRGGNGAEEGERGGEDYVRGALGSGEYDQSQPDQEADGPMEMQAQVGNEMPLSNAAASPAIESVAAVSDYLSGSTAINPSAYLDDDEEAEAEEVVAQEAVTTAIPVRIMTGDSTASPLGATRNATAPVVAADTPPVVIIDTTAQTKQLIDEKAIKELGTTAIDVVFFLAETAFKAAAPIVRDGGATALGRIQEALFPDNGSLGELRKSEARAKRENAAANNNSSALARILLEPRGSDVAESRLLGTLRGQKRRDL